MERWAFLISICSLLVFYDCASGQTMITKWYENKKGAVSITYDDGSMNQFRYALPIMERLKLPATFYIITGPIAGSKYPGKFVGRPVQEIINETAKIPTDDQNYFERISAAKYLGYIGAFRYNDSSASLYEDGKEKEAYLVVDKLYEKVRNGELRKGIELSMEVAGENGLSWDSIKIYSAKGYEFASHTITHAHIAVLDPANIDYELGKSKEDLKNHLGEKYCFSAEIPFGIEHPRAMKYSLPYYSALRNLMTDSFMEEINRGYKTQPGASTKDYVQWQRGPLTKTSIAQMKSWVDTVMAHDKIWLVLVFHGIDGMGYEPLTHQVLDTYFTYIKSREKDLWIATFSDVAKYMRERMHANVSAEKIKNGIRIKLTHSLNTSDYNLPLTLKTYIPSLWKTAYIKQGEGQNRVTIRKDNKGSYVIYSAMPNSEILVTGQL